jgi:hypothetical protein
MSKDKDYLKRLDEFLSCFDPEEMIRDGIHFIKFKYESRGKKITKTYTPATLKAEKEQRACNI